MVSILKEEFKMTKFYLCERCKNLVEVVYETPVPLMCCGQKMTELVPNTVDAATEKHVPEVTVEGNVVKAQVGSVEHPMEDKHYIMFILLETDQGVRRKDLKPGEKPVAEFALLEGENQLLYMNTVTYTDYGKKIYKK